MTAGKKVIAVSGATGAQGGGLVRAILADAPQRFAVRAITRKPDGPAAEALARSGAEVAPGDLDDPLSLKRALSGAHGLFAVTNYWEHLSPEREITQASNIAHAAKTAGVEHVIWSTLEDTREKVPLSDSRMPTLAGRYKVPHFDGKGEADARFAELPVTRLRTSFFWDNLIHLGAGPRRGDDGTLFFLLPMNDRKMPGIAASDIGACAYRLFLRGEAAIGATVGIAGEHLTGAQMAGHLGAVLGEPVRHASMPFAEYAALGFPGADDLANMYQYMYEFNEAFCAARPVDATRDLHPGVSTFRQWLEQNVRHLLPALQ